MKRFMLVFAFLGSLTFLSAQPFNSAVGFRAGYPVGVSYKFFLDSSNAIDLGAGFSGYGIGNSFGAIALYEIHADLDLEIENFQWYYGFGASVNFWNYAGFNGAFLGGHGVIGLSYTFESSPVNLSVDWAPGLNFGFSDLYYDGIFFSHYGALTGRYVLD